MMILAILLPIVLTGCPRHDVLRITLDNRTGYVLDITANGEPFLASGRSLEAGGKVTVVDARTSWQKPVTIQGRDQEGRVRYEARWSLEELEASNFTIVIE